MQLLVYDMSVNVNGIYYVHVCEQARLARSVGNSAIENLCIIMTSQISTGRHQMTSCMAVQLSRLSNVDLQETRP